MSDELTKSHGFSSLEWIQPTRVSRAVAQKGRTALAAWNGFNRESWKKELKWRRTALAAWNGFNSEKPTFPSCMDVAQL